MLEAIRPFAPLATERPATDINKGMDAKLVALSASKPRCQPFLSILNATASFCNVRVIFGIHRILRRLDFSSGRARFHFQALKTLEFGTDDLFFRAAELASFFRRCSKTPPGFCIGFESVGPMRCAVDAQEVLLALMTEMPATCNALQMTLDAPEVLRAYVAMSRDGHRRPACKPPLVWE